MRDNFGFRMSDFGFFGNHSWQSNHLPPGGGEAEEKKTDGTVFPSSWRESFPILHPVQPLRLPEVDDYYALRDAL